MQKVKNQYKIQDTDRLYLLVTPAGGKYWHFNYRDDRKRKTLALGIYPEITLLDARSKLLEARKALMQDIDPGQQSQRK